MSHSPIGGDGVLRYPERLCVSNVDNLRNCVLEKAHGSRYSTHLGSTKIYHDIREVFYCHAISRREESRFGCVFITIRG